MIRFDGITLSVRKADDSIKYKVTITDDLGNFKIIFPYYSSLEYNSEDELIFDILKSIHQGNVLNDEVKAIELTQVIDTNIGANKIEKALNSLKVKIKIKEGVYVKVKNGHYYSSGRYGRVEHIGSASEEVYIRYLDDEFRVREERIPMEEIEYIADYVPPQYLLRSDFIELMNTLSSLSGGEEYLRKAFKLIWDM